MNVGNLSIRRKLTLLAMLTSSIAVVLSSASFLIYDLVSFRHLLSQDLGTQARIIAYNSAAAMAFKDEASAKVTLSALTAKDDVVAAALYNTDGIMFASYFRATDPHPALPKLLEVRGSRFNGNYIEVFNDVTLRGERVGTLFLQSDMQRWNTRARQYAGILGIFVLISGLFAWLVSSKLQVMVSGPILELEQTMRSVSMDKNYAVRAVKSCGDEIGRLIDGFNTMLSEIQHGDKALQRANDELKTRTQELEQEIIHRKRTQEELLKAKQAAEEANRAKSAFLANMSHELRTPLNAIIGYSEMLEEETRDVGRIENVADLQRIQAAGKHLLSLINDVLDLSKIEAGKMGLHLETFTVQAMIEEIVTTLQAAAQKNSNRIVVHLAHDIGSMHADVTKVRQILFNLLSNACKFTDHGTITVQAERHTKDKDWIVVRVTDTGIGMTEDQQWNLFQDFTQADASISRKYGGTGLGLAISFRFALMMHGHIRVESQPGEGSTFTVELPAEVTMEAAEPAVTPAASSMVTEEPGSRRDADTVLVIDDDAAVRDLMTRFLGKMGFHAVSAANGDEGLRLAEKIQPSIITLDVIMPGLNGWDVLGQLKAKPELASIPVIMITIVDNETMGLEKGASNYLVKPIDRDRLALALEKYRSRPASQEGDVEMAHSRRG
jgi:signal transduction histidine kinase/ActR/RegA family two-component response regulator